MSVAGLGVTVGSNIVFSRQSWAKTPPNIVYISIDDLGWPEFGCYGHTFNETPNIDRLASQGIRFTDAYAASTVCSPTRASLMTGLYPGRTGITDYLQGVNYPGLKFMPEDFVTLPELLRHSDYVSGLIGKWHLTEDYATPLDARQGSPRAQGFDKVILSEIQQIGPGDFFHPYRHLPGVEAREEGEYLTDRLGQEAVDFITATKDRPFFLHLSNYAVHTRLDAKPEMIARYESKPGAEEDGNNPVLAAMLESVDQQVGLVVSKLEDLRLANNTLVMVTSDNGGDPEATSTNAPLRGFKSQLYEGGIRVALVAYWPGVIAPGNISRVPVSTVDVFPTILDLAGIKATPDNAFDGESLVPVLRQAGELKRTHLFWFYPHDHFLGGTPQAAVRSGRYKLIKDLRTGRSELYDLKEDIGESNDLVTKMPMQAAALRRALDAHIEEMRLVPPVPTSSDYPRVELTDTFETDTGAYTVLTPPPPQNGGQVSVEDGALRVSGDAEFFALLRSQTVAKVPTLAVIVDVGRFAGSASSVDDTVFVGLVKDESNYVTVWHNNALKRTGWRVVRDGVVMHQPIPQLDNRVHLSPPQARFAFVLLGDAISAFVDNGTGWEFLLVEDLRVRNILNLSDPAVLAEYSYGFGVRASAGSIALDGVEVRTR